MVRNNLPAGTYGVTLNDAQGCSITRQFVITEPTQLVLDGIITNATDCNDPNSGAIDLLVSGGTTPYTFVWSNGATTEDLQNIGPNNYLVIVTDARGCMIQQSFSVVRPDPITATIVNSVSADCTTRTVIQRNIVNTSGGAPPLTISWSAGTVSGANGEIMETSQNGTYFADITDSFGCTERVSVDVNLPVISVPNFEFSSLGLTNYGEFSIEDPITFTNLSTGNAVTYFWSFGDGATSAEEHPMHTYAQPGIYDVQLTVEYPYSCRYTHTITITVTEGYNLVIPTAFTPNGDNINDVMKPVFRGMNEVEMRVYNTWGSLVYSEKGPNLTGWDGTINGNKAENGNYVIVVKATVFYGRIIERNGPIALIK
ncbi:MAG: PKD domain-containing protein [Flavobacteriaceae bacterium]|nr:MAG: PKD domain-containing protein [Flavobacteriaceae bacterium]